MRSVTSGSDSGAAVSQWKGFLLRFLDQLAAHPRRSALIIFVLAAGVRFAILALYLLSGHQLYTGEAENIARSLVSNGSFADPYAIPTGPTAHCPPVYPVIVALIYAFCGMGMTGQVARCASGILAFSALYSLFPWIAVRFGLDRRAGVLAGLFGALLPTKRSAEILGGGWETPYAAMALSVLLIWALELWREPRLNWWRGLLWGAAWGAASLLQTSFFAIFLLITALLVTRFLRRHIPLARIRVPPRPRSLDPPQSP
jgi:hypothetical protein